MHITLLKAKLHRTCVTHAELDYEGSCAIDTDWLELSGIREYEQLHIYNINNGERFSTYAIKAEAGSRVISLNGAAARKAAVGDRLIICTYASMLAEQADDFEPTLVYFDDTNRVTHTKHAIPVQPATPPAKQPAT